MSAPAPSPPGAAVAEPAVAEPAVQPEALSREQKRALLAKLLRKQAVHTQTAPASFGQERLWFLSQLVAGKPVYNIPVTLRIEGVLHHEALRRVLEAIVGRHQTLRTTFRTVAGALIQEIAAGGAVRLPMIDLGGLPEAARKATEKQIGLAIGSWRFDLARGPLWVGHLVRSGARDHVLQMTVHHTVFDDWSARLLGKELKLLYQAYTSGEASPLPELPFQYGDFVRWQRESFKHRDFEASLDYWRARLEGAPALDLPLDRPRPAVQTYAGGHERFNVPDQLLDVLRSFNQRWGTTLFMSILAIYKALLSRHAATDDVAVGSPTAGRNRTELETLIGFFVNTLVLRTDLSGDPTFHQLMSRVREVVSGGLTHQEVPFERIVKALQLERDTSRNPLFQAGFVMLQVTSADYQLAGTKVRFVETLHPTAKFDLMLTFASNRSGMSGLFEYNTDLFDRAAMCRLADGFVRLLEAVAADPERRLSELRSSSEAERWQQLGEWNDSALTAVRRGTLAALWQAQARRTPEAVALIAGSRRLTYADLDRLAGRLAAELRALGVGPEVPVAVFLERSPELVVALLAVLVAGGAYVPLDPAYPAERLGFILADARTPVVLTQARLAGRLPPSAARLLLVDGERRPAAGPAGDAAASAPPPAAVAGNLAYVIYTSGSTGKPKGVAIEHGSACAFLEWAWQLFGADELDGVLASTSICFDLSVFEIFVPLCSGGKVILAANALELPALAAAGEVRLLNTVPSALAELLRAGLPDSVRTINLAGEPVVRALVDHAYELPQVQRLYNLYGPSEDTTYSTFARLDRGVTAAPPIGRPVAGGRVRLLDRNLQVVPLGSIGELCIAGAGLARGYLDRPALTAERFMPDELGEPGSRLYHTGDLARYRSDGNLQFLGRLDHQVKVRGYRIELGEIEAVLGSHSLLREVVVMLGKAPGGEPRLVAYCVPEPDQALPSPEALRAHLSGRLPEYMVPAVFVPLAELPRTPNGKLDRKALPAVDSSRPDLEVRYVAPADDLETTIAAIWQGLLGVDRVGVQDNFFDLGGSSLLLVQVNQRLQQKLGRSLPILSLLNYATVRALARHLADRPLGEEAAATDAGRPGLLDQAKSRLRQQLGARDLGR